MNNNGPGGAREGAGRPPGAKYPHRVTVLLTERQYEHVKNMHSDTLFDSASDFIRQLIDDDIVFDPRGDGE